ncbi:MAG: fimbria major subunit [Muribaculaceae bacterium]|nr:fimbria major subunit [Muribaculaceae bacterium]
MKKFYGYAFAAAALMLASCSSDDAPEVNPVNGDVVGYIKMELPAGTRADGDKVVFTKNGAPVAATLAPGQTEVFALTAIPDRVVVFRGDNSLYDSQTATTTNKSGYSPAVLANNTYGASVSAANIFHSLDAAAIAAATPVDIYLDPVVAKVTVKAEVKADLSEQKFDGFSISFEPEYVFVNGVATKTPMIKTMPTGKTNLDFDLSSAAAGYATGSHWTKTDYAWNTDDVLHYSLTGTNVGNKAKVQNEEHIFERARQSASELTKDFTHIIVAGQYKLTATGSKTLPTDENWDGTFYVYGANANGEGYVFFTEVDVIKAMGGTGADGEKLEYAKTTPGGMSTHMTFGTESCVKYDKGYVYYSKAIETAINGNKIGKGVVRNHAYIVTVNQIKGWGTAIPNTDEPIIPEDPRDPETNFIKLNIVVNPFVNVDGQIVGWE